MTLLSLDLSYRSKMFISLLGLFNWWNGYEFDNDRLDSIFGQKTRMKVLINCCMERHSLH